LFAFLLFLAFFLRAIFMQHGMNWLNDVSFRSASSMQALVLDKLLKLKSTTRNYLNTGKIITTSTIDAFAVYGLFQMANLIISTPFVLVISIILVIVEIGVVGLAGLLMIIVGTFASSFVTRKFSATRKENLKFSDKRSRTIEEFISGIRLIKYYGWEKMVISKIQDIRNIETNFLFIGTILRAVMDFIVNLTPLAINLAVFGLYVA
jgi:ABC-type multidrug transport system fused ATPase/permease subunit